MHRTLHGKLAAVLFGLLCLTALLYIPLTLMATQRYLQESNQKLNRTLAEHVAEHLASKNMLRKDLRSRAQATAEIAKLMVINPSVEVYLLDASGDIVAYSSAPGKVQMDRVAVDPLQRVLSGSRITPILGNDPRHPKEQKIFSVSPIPVKGYQGKGQIKGYVYIILGGEEYDTIARFLQKSYIMRVSLTIAAGILCWVLLTGVFLFRFLTRRLRNLTCAMEEFQQREFLDTTNSSRRKNIRSGDEIDRLGNVFHHMVGRIEEQVRELHRADVQRRELVSNVSHDLRTPLSALRGYLETLRMKEGLLTEVEQRNYLTIALRHSDRLGKLVSELFELARLDAREVQVRIEPFLLAELVQDVMQKFQLAAAKQQLRLETNLATDLPFVCADIALIERVLDNLIVNAMRYTPAAGSITVFLVLGDAAVNVKVQDTGRGIRQEDLPHIFERYYRVEDQPEIPGCAGLGLAITKRILELHNSAIEVHSVPGSGTTFIFSLPACKP